MSAKFTPGPWEYVSKLSASENHKGFFVRAEKHTKNGKWSLAEIQPVDEDGKVGGANARLIAAAPELLEACKRMMLWFEVEDDHSKMPEFMHRVDLCNQVEMLASAAIAKATGEPQ